MKQQDYSISDWIDEKVMRGYYTFTIEDVKKNFPQFGDAYVRTSLYRLTIKKKIISPWKGFYVIMPIEFALKAIIPPVFYIDALMSFLNKKYYISLLNAASFYGASHQRAQTFSVITEAPKLRNTAKTGTSILPSKSPKGLRLGLSHSIRMPWYKIPMSTPVSNKIKRPPATQ